MAMEAQRQEELAQRIRDLRGRTPQRVIAERVGVTERAYQEWEGGGGIAWENLTTLAEVLGVSEEYLIYGEAGDAARTGTHIERLLEGQRRLEAKLDALLVHAGLDAAEIAIAAEQSLSVLEGAAGTPASGAPSQPGTQPRGGELPEHQPAPARHAAKRRAATRTSRT
jgi:transcriptional regulator with XRE-family HTH domain